ncbi:MAG: hypothetical protein PHI13_15185 [Methylococcales bacterium]|nr:hypothetical protein [Methylococcales bacterium]
MSPSEKTKNAIAESGNLQQFRIFLASPGDVPLERKLARDAITHISSERRFRGRINTCGGTTLSHFQERIGGVTPGGASLAVG